MKHLLLGFGLFLVLGPVLLMLLPERLQDQVGRFWVQSIQVTVILGCVGAAIGVALLVLGKLFLY